MAEVAKHGQAQNLSKDQAQKAMDKLATLIADREKHVFDHHAKMESVPGASASASNDDIPF